MGTTLSNPVEKNNNNTTKVYVYRISNITQVSHFILLLLAYKSITFNFIVF